MEEDQVPTPLPMNPIDQWRSYALSTMRNEKIGLCELKRQFESDLNRFISEHRNIRHRNLIEKVVARFKGEEPMVYSSHRWRMENFAHLARVKADVQHRQANYDRTCDQIATLMAQHRRRDFVRGMVSEWAEQVPEKTCANPVPRFDDLFDVKVKVKVKTESGVKIVIRAPYAELHHRWHSKGRRPPIDRVVQAFAQLGFPMTYLQRILEIHDRELKMKPKIEAFIEKVFERMKKKKKKESD